MQYAPHLNDFSVLQVMLWGTIVLHWNLRKLRLRVTVWSGNLCEYRTICILTKLAAMKIKQTPIYSQCGDKNSCHNFEVTIMTAIVTILCVKFCPDKGFCLTIYCLVTDYLTYSSARIGSPVHRAFTEGKQHKRRSFTPSIMDQTVKTAL